MKTTLKRGIGRSAETNGNGHVVLPPGVLTPVTRYRQPKQRRALRFVGAVLLAIVAAVTSAGLGLAGGYYLFLHESIDDVRPHSAEVRAAQQRLDKVPPPGEPAIALAIGYDQRPEDVKLGNKARSDTVMLMRADPNTDTISMLSFPRDLVVEIHCPGRSPYLAKINAAYADCDVRGTLETVRHLTGVPINYLITVNFRGFKQAVAKLGGVWMDVDRRYFNDNSRNAPGFTFATIDLKPGYQKLNGQKALDFVRYRHTDSDFYRIARQQLFVKALKQQVAASFLPTSVPKLVKAVTKNVQIAQGGGSEISGETLLRYAVFAYQLPPGYFFQARLEGVYDTGGSDIAVDASNVQAAVQDFLNPDVDAPAKATAVALRKKLKLKSGPEPRSVSMIVLNGNGVAGSATNAGFLLRERGYDVVEVPDGNAPNFDYFRTQVYYDPAQADARAAAAKVADVFGSADVKPIPPEVAPPEGADLVVVLGRTFTGTLAPAPVDKTPRRQPPNVVRNPDVSRDLLADAQKRVDYPLLIPTLIERTSRPDPEQALHVYRIADKHRTVRLTYRTGANEWWGIQMMDWEDAPALAEKNTTQVIGGRTYDLYYSGPLLHMVVLRDGERTYWVVNTLLDSLSNETMLAIARGLQPLKK